MRNWHQDIIKLSQARELITLANNPNYLGNPKIFSAAQSLRL
jgi:hypothetical protein